MKKKRTLITILCILIIVICCLYVLWLHKPSQGTNERTEIEVDTNAEDWNGEQKLNHLKQAVKNIAIPGIKSLVFDADKTSQKVNFFNPAENDCVIQFTLYVEDKEMWQSGYCEAGKGYYNIELASPLAAGTYQANLYYGCRKEDGTELNSANVTFTLYVQ